MINSKKKGNAYEVQVANELTEFTGVKHYTNRNVNKLADDRKVDITSDLLGFNIQCKNLKTNANYSSIIKDMEDNNPESKYINLLFSKVTRKGEFVILRKTDFINLIKLMQDGE